MTIENIEVVPLTEHIGVGLRGVDFERMAPTRAFTRLMKDLLDEHRLVLIRKQHIEPSTAETFTANFGPLLDIKRKGWGDPLHVPGAEWIKVISNGTDPETDRLYGDGNSSQQMWHTDSTSWEAPVGHIAFYCRITCDPAPLTYFMDMIKVYAALPEDVKERIAKLRAIHHFFPRQIEPEIHRTAPSMSLEDRRRGIVHPLVRRHLGTGKPILYLPTRRDSLIVGMEEPESFELLTWLWDFTDAQPFKVSHAMMPDDFVIWDNSATVHSRDGWADEKVRMMWHISAEGEVPIPMFPKRTLNTIGLSTDEARKVNADLAPVDY